MARVTGRLSGLATGLHDFRQWRKDGTWLQIHDPLQAWMRVVDGCLSVDCRGGAATRANAGVLVLLKKRWGVERTFGWLMGCRHSPGL